ncbi:MAG TPA: hypothetical protein VMF69_10210 [Gemmataceae bacterium]|nr:hypothetical protein [Gemmataceae bacterium]
MDPVDQLTMAVQAAQALRTAKNPEEVLAGAYSVIEKPVPADAGEPMAVRIARLMAWAGEHRRELLDFLEQHARGPFLNRLPGGWGESEKDEAERHEDPEAASLLERVESDEAKGRDMFADTFPPFSVAGRRIEGTFGGRTLIERNGQRLTQEEAGEIQGGDGIYFEKEDLPVTVRGLIDYPLETPVLFTIEVGEEPWSLWDICCAFADQYAKIYETAERYGIWGHDITDLWIERLVYYPEQRLIYPFMGS